MNKIKKERYIIATIKSWNIEEAQKFISKDTKAKVLLITDKKDLIYSKVKKFSPRFIFFPHWSWIIPKEIYSNFECVVFHMTDLPFGRGGSPLQNLIVRGIERTKISAIKVVRELDAGPIYMKEDLNLKGSAEWIFKRASKIIFNKMIPCIVENNPIPKKQNGRIVTFKRRVAEESNLKELKNVRQIYDYIRMLDAEGYPNVFLEMKNLKLKFRKARFKNNKLEAEVEIEVKK